MTYRDANISEEIEVKADPDQEDCLLSAQAEYILAHPELDGYDLSPSWADETRETITLVVPCWSMAR